MFLHPPLKWRRTAVALTCALAATVLVACGDDEKPAASAAAGTPTTSAADGIAAAKKELVTASAAKSEWTGPTTAPKPVTGKTIGVMPCGKAVEGCAREARGAVEAAKELGWKTIELDPQFDPQKTSAAMNTFITRKVDGIFIASINPAAIAEQIQRAKKQGIFTVAAFSADPTPFGGFAEVGIDDEAAGRAAAAYVVSNGGGDVAIFNQNDSPPVAERAEGFKAALDEWGTAKIVSDQALTGAQLGPPQVPLMQALLKQRPKGQLDWVFSGFDFMLTPLVQTAVREGRDDVKGISYDGNQQNLDFIREGKGQVAVIGYPLEWSGWAGVDQLNRAMNGEPAAKDAGLSFRVLDKASIPPAGKAYVGDLDFRSQYRKIWGK
jgi:ribose transport system substrate-binding protein